MAKTKDTKEQKEAALDRAVQEIEKQFGKGAIMMLGADTYPRVPSISTGSISLDIATGVGGIPRGRVTTHTLIAPGMVVGDTRKIHLYQPPTQEPSPLIIAFDGREYLKRVPLPTLLDNLIADKKIRPVAVAMIENSTMAKGSARMAEYAMNELTLLFVLTQVLPFAQKHLDLVSPKKVPGAYAVMGASMGGLMAVFTALRAPHIFGTAISHAGAFELWDERPFIFDLAALPMQNRPRVWLDVGRLDWLLGANRRMNKHLRAQKFVVEYREYYAYHGRELQVRPSNPNSLSGAEFLRWHNEQRFKA